MPDRLVAADREAHRPPSPGAVLSAGLDGGLRAYSTSDGSIIWLFDTNKDFETINGVAARGGAMDHGGGRRRGTG